MSRVPRPLMVVVLLLLTGAGVSVAAGPPGTAPVGAGRARPVPVVRSSAGCPQPFDVTGASTTVGVATPGLPPALAGTAGSATASPRGSASLRDVGPAGTSRLRVPEASGTVVIAPGSPALVATADGSRAPGLSAAEVSRIPSGDLRGLAGTSCVPPGTDFWFVGSGAEVGQRGRLYLTNPESAPALVDVTLYGPSGPLDTPSAKGVSVAAGAQEVLVLDALAPATSRFGVHVEVRQGRVSAALRDQQLRGLDPQGVDWVPPAVPPSRRVVVPAVPAGQGERHLQVLAPGQDDVIVRVRLLAASGPFVPAGADVIEVPAGSVADVDLAPYARGDDVSVELTGDGPVTAGLLVRTGTGKQARELAYSAAAASLTAVTPGVVPLVALGTAAPGTLVLAAPGRDARVTVSPLLPGTVAPVMVDVPSGTEVTVDLAQLRGASAAAVVPAASSGPVVAARVLSEAEKRGPMLTIEPVLPGRYTVLAPRVRSDLSTGLRSSR